MWKLIFSLCFSSTHTRCLTLHWINAIFSELLAFSKPLLFSMYYVFYFRWMGLQILQSNSLQNAIPINFNGVKPDVKKWKTYLSVREATVYHYFPKACVLALYILKPSLGWAVRHTRPHSAGAVQAIQSSHALVLCAARVFTPLGMHSL